MLARHLFSQTDTLRALSTAALRSALGVRGAGGGETTIVRTLPPRPDALVDDHVRVTGGDLGAYRSTVPPHLFPQWLFPLGAEAWSRLPYDLLQVMNLGAEMEVLGAIPRGKPLDVTFRLANVDDDGRRVLVTQALETSVGGEPKLRATVTAYLPLPRKDGAKRESKQLPLVPLDAEEIAFERLPADLGRRFAFVTGDVNPLHWVGPWARAMGHRTPILHGFCTFARAVERVIRARAAGDPTRLARFEARFTRPLPLPSRVGTYLVGDRVHVGDAPGGVAYLQGSFSLR